MPADLKEDMEKTVTSKPEVINWLKRSLDAVREAHLTAKPNDLERKVHIADRDATVDGMYLRIICSCQRTHGAADRVRAHDWRCAALAKS